MLTARGGWAAVHHPREHGHLGTTGLLEAWQGRGMARSRVDWLNGRLDAGARVRRVA